MKLIPRTTYMNFLKRHKDHPIMKVVTGVRRCGKSTLLKEYQQSLLSDDVAPEQITAINFEDIANEPLCDYHALYQYITRRLVPGEMNYIFLDEIQHVREFEKVADSLFIKDNVDLYLTGSNAYFLSGDLATLLSGRYVEINMLPLSFAEFCSALSENQSLEESYTEYMRYGSFPYVFQIGKNDWAVDEYLRGIYNTILLKDVVARLRVDNVDILDHVARYLMANIGSEQSMRKIAGALTSRGLKTDAKTVQRYIRGLKDSLLIYEAPRFNVHGKELLSGNAKYYAVDPGMRNMLTASPARDAGHLLENVVYLELLRRYPEVYVGNVPGSEIDFVCKDSSGFTYYQVALTTLDETVLQRELKPLLEIKDAYPKYLLTLDTVYGEADYDGIKKRNALKWMVGK